jgi:predicted DNA-binding transcriptional regulator AlpA
MTVLTQNNKAKKTSSYPSYLPKVGEGDRFLRLNQIVEMLGIGKSTVYNLMYKGEFPKQIKLGYKLAVWRESDIRAYMDNAVSKNIP